MPELDIDPPLNAERHLAAILACDVVRSSWHMERKEEETIRRLRDLRQNLIQPRVAEHRGRIFKTMGDGFLAEFLSALDAVHCAIGIQSLMAQRNLDLPEDDRLQLRIGINLGDVFREGDDVFGDGVNVAARLENSAPPGGIRVSRSVCDPIRDRFSFRFDDIGEQQFHNITRAIHVFEVRIDDGPDHLEPKPPTPSEPDSRPGRESHVPISRRTSALVAGIVLAVGVSASIWLGMHLSRNAAPIPDDAGSQTSSLRSTQNPLAAGDGDTPVAKTPAESTPSARGNQPPDQANPPPSSSPSAPEPSETAGDISTADATKRGFQALNQKDFAEAMKWFRKAGNQGNAEAQTQVGLLYESGFGVEKNFQEAMRWFRLAADQGYAEAQTQIGLLYRNGFGVQQDPKTACEWYQKAADQNYPMAQVYLGACYAFGQGMPKDINKEIELFQKAANEGDTTGAAMLGTLYLTGNGVAKNYTTAKKLFQEAAEKGNAVAMNALGTMFMYGYGVEADYPEAMRWFQKSIDLQNFGANTNVGILYVNGWGVPKDYGEALRRFRIAAYNNDSIGQYNLGLLYRLGWGVPVDYKEAMNWFRKSAAQSYGPAFNDIGALYGNGLGVPVDYAEAMRWYRLAVNLNNGPAAVNIGVLYHYGQGVKKDDSEVRRWFQRGADLGSPDAKSWLMQLGGE